MKQFNSDVIKKFALDVKVGNTEKNTPYELVKEILSDQGRAKNAGNEYEELWVVFDKDNHPKMLEAFSLAKSRGVKIAFSSVSFEYWILLHFRKTTKPYRSCSELIADLKKDLPNFEKNTKKIYLDVKDLTQLAIENAHHLRAQLATSHLGVPVYETNPYVNVDNLVQMLLNNGKNYSIPTDLKMTLKR